MFAILAAIEISMAARKSFVVRMWRWRPTAKPPLSRCSTRFELSDFKNSLQSLGSAGIAIECSAEKFEGLEALNGRAGEPVGNRVVGIGRFEIPGKLLDQ